MKTLKEKEIIHEESETITAFRRFESKDVKEAILKLKNKLCYCKSLNSVQCQSCDEIKNILGDF